MAQETGTRIVVTSRSSFWESEINSGSDESGDKSFESGSYLYHIQPFGSEQAKKYFQLKLGNDNEKINLAVNLFSELNRDDPSFAGRGFVLLLISDLVKFGYERAGEQVSEKPLIRLIRAHCDRELVRHGLQLSSQQQLDILESFVYETVQNEPATSDTMSFAIKSVVHDLSDETISATLEKMAPHALVVREKGEWAIRQTQVRMALLASKLIKMTKDKSECKLLQTFSSKAQLDSGEVVDLAAMIFSVASWGKAAPDALECVRLIIQSFFEASESSIDGLKEQVLRRLSTALAFRAIEADKQAKNHIDRAKMLASLFPNKQLAGVVLFGGVSRYDFLGFTFEKCIFDSVRWANCKFGQDTIFRNGRLLGGSATHCTGLENINMQNMQTDEEGRRFIETEAILKGKKKYTEDNLKNDLYAALEQFIGKGGVGFKAVELSVYGRGKISASPHKDKILDEIKNQLLGEHHVSAGSKKALALSDEAKDSVRAMMSNNIITGVLLGLFNNLKSKLVG